MIARSRNLAVGLVALLGLPLVATTKATVNSGEQSKPVAQIWADAKTAMSTAKDFHVLGHIDEAGTGLISLNLSMSPTGGGGSVTVPGATLEIVVAASYVYIKANEKSWQKLTGSKATAELVAGKWIKAPASSSDFSSFAQLTNSKKFTNQLTSGAAGFSKVGKSTWDGHEAVVLTDTEGDRIWVATSGAHYLLHIQGKGSSASGSLTFSDFGDAPMPSVPATSISLPSGA